MCKVFLGEIAGVDRGFGDLHRRWGVDKILGLRGLGTLGPHSCTKNVHEWATQKPLGNLFLHFFHKAIDMHWRNDSQGKLQHPHAQ